MIKFFRLPAIVFAAVLFAATASAQAPARIGVIESNRFSDEKTGISKYVNAFKKVNTEFDAVAKELETMQTKYQNLVKEINDLQAKAKAGTLPVDQKFAQAKVDEAAQLERDIKFKADDAKARYDRRSQDELTPIQQDIGKALNEYAKLKGFSLIFDASKDEVGLLVAIGDDKIDVTTDFIAFYNARSAAPASPAKP